MGLGVADALGGVVFLFGGVAPEIRVNLRFLCHCDGGCEKVR